MKLDIKHLLKDKNTNSAVVRYLGQVIVTSMAIMFMYTYSLLFYYIGAAGPDCPVDNEVFGMFTITLSFLILPNFVYRHPMMNVKRRYSLVLIPLAIASVILLYCLNEQLIKVILRASGIDTLFNLEYYLDIPYPFICLFNDCSLVPDLPGYYYLPFFTGIFILALYSIRYVFYSHT